MDQPDLKAPQLSLAFRAHVTVGPILSLGVVDGVEKRIVAITGGTISGPRLSATVLPGGTDWQNVSDDGTARIFARYTLKTDDGTLISLTNPGLRTGPPAVLARLAAGETVDPALYYFRTTPSFEVGQGPHHWLTRGIFVCNAARYPAHVALAFYLVQ